MALSRSKSIENLQTNVCCSICHEPWTRPKTLPCDHIFCEECLEELIRKSASGKIFRCPLCRKVHLVPSEGVRASWTTSRALENLADGFRSIKSSSSVSQLSTPDADPEKSFIRKSPSRKVVIGQMYSMNVQLCDEDGNQISAQPGRYDIKAYVDLKPTPLGYERQELEPTMTKQGKVFIEFKAQTCGVHELTIHLENRSIKGSPLVISVVPRGIFGCEVRGPLQGPCDVVSYQGNFLVADVKARAVYLVDQTGQELLSLKVPKTMARDFFPNAITTFQQKIFVADVNHRCIHVYDNLYNFPKQFGDQHLQRPTGIAVSIGSGDIFIVDNERKLVVVFNQDYRYIKTINYQARNREDALCNPQMAVMNSSGDQLYIADQGERGTENYIKVINVIDDKLERKICVRVGKNQARPNGIDIDSNGNVYVSVCFQEFVKRQGDGKPEKPPRVSGGINVYSSVGQYLGHFGAELERPNGLVILPASATSASIAYVADSYGRSPKGSLKGFIM
ncbi:Tripartite motif-containing protein 2 [Holothuria leucospilota]|uniref:Tripartite motif-containing protein 2 n=1 Tax=Holothuria leucospilota TaxID=206669 RepID=A0A9Q1C579_HOLLE|nr:Tripartite motif-containing protein 2 [Holothuria leucospilota]